MSTVENPRDFDLTFAACELLVPRQQPLYLGALVGFFFRLLDSDGNPVELIPGTVVTLYLSDGETTIERDSETEIPDTGGVHEIEIRANQTTTGKGWYEAWFYPAETVLTPIVGLAREYKTKVALSATNVIYPHFKGLIDIGS